MFSEEILKKKGINVLKKYIFILTLFFAQTAVFGQSGNEPIIWFPAGIPPEANNAVLYGVDYVDANNGCIVGYDTVNHMEVILVTRDGIKFNSPSDFNPYYNFIPKDVSLADKMNGVAVGSNSKILTSNNLGEDWVMTIFAGDYDFLGVKMVDIESAFHIWIVSDDGEIRHSPDGGNTWPSQYYDPGTVFRAIDFVYKEATFDTCGIVVGDSGKIIFTTDGGVTWNSPDVGGEPPQDVDFYGVSLVEQGGSFMGCAVGTGDTIYMTSDTGHTWTGYWVADLSPIDTLFGVNFTNPQYGCAVGKSPTKGGIILYTETSGSSWTEQKNRDPSIPRKPLYDVALAYSAFDSTGPYGYAVGGDPNAVSPKGVFLTFPAFEVYKLAPNPAPADSFVAIVAVNDSIDSTKYSIISFETNILYDSTIAIPRNVIITDSAEVTNISNFSISSNKSHSATSYDTLRISGAGETGIGGFGEIFHVKFDVLSPGGDPAVKLEYFRFNEGLPGAIALPTVPFKYGDVDLDFQITTADASLILKYRVNLAVFQTGGYERADVSGMIGVTAYDAGLILQRIASLITAFPAESGAKSSPIFDNSSAEIFVSKDSKALNTIVYQIDADKIYGVLSAEFLLNYDEQNLIYTGYELTESTSGFLVQTSKKENGILSIAMAGNRQLNEKAGLISLKFEKFGDVSEELQIISAVLNESSVENINQKDLSTPDRFALFQNFPNPFNPETEIRYQLPENSEVILKIYNITGQEIRTLVNDVKSAGIYKVKWDGKNDFGITVSSGVYLYRFKAEGFVQTRKLVFLK